MNDREVYDITYRLFDGKCAFCGNPNVAMHHIRYGKCGRKTYLGNVIPLCVKHHNLVHTSKRTYQPILIEMIDERLEDDNFRIICRN